MFFYLALVLLAHLFPLSSRNTASSASLDATAASRTSVLWLLVDVSLLRYVVGTSLVRGSDVTWRGRCHALSWIIHDAVVNTCQLTVFLLSSSLNVSHVLVLLCSSTASSYLSLRVHQRTAGPGDDSVAVTATLTSLV